MKRRTMMVLLAVLLLGLTACGRGETPEPVTEITETVPETTVWETTAVETGLWDFTAEEVTGSIRLALGSWDLTKRLTDGQRESGASMKSDGVLTIESDHPFSALYLEWGSIPRPYRIGWEGGRQACGGEGFQHDYIYLNETVTAATLTFEGGEGVLCEVRAFTEGAVPEGVQDWQAPGRQADILVFPTHADDDVLFFGALMSYYAIEKHLNVQTAFLTRHYDEPHRAHERLDGLWELGIRHYPVLSDAPDLYSKSLEKARQQYAGYDLLGWQIQQIRRFRPQVIVGHDLNGEYGHGGHMLGAHTLVEAVEQAADANAYPETARELGVWDAPKLYLHLYPDNRIRLDVNTMLQEDPQGRTPFQVAVDAYTHHKSQHKWSFRVTQEDSNENCVEFGLYRTLVGPDTGSDVMEHIG